MQKQHRKMLQPYSRILTYQLFKVKVETALIQALQVKTVKSLKSDFMSKLSWGLCWCVQPVVSAAAAPVSDTRRPEGWATPPGCRWWLLLYPEHHCAGVQGSGSFPWSQELRREESEQPGGSGSPTLSWSRAAPRACPCRAGRSIPGWSGSREAAPQLGPRCRRAARPTNLPGRARGWEGDSAARKSSPGWCWGWDPEPQRWPQTIRSIWL